MRKLLLALTGVLLFLMPNTNYGQAPTLGTAANFVLFSSNGAVTNSGNSHITGDVGQASPAGSISGFGNVNGSMHNGDAVAIAAAADLLTAYAQLNAAVPTAVTGPTLGNGDTLIAGVYSVLSAGTLNGNLTLNGQGNANAVFIFQIGGAFSTNAVSKIKLINGAQACNVFWKVEGQVIMGAASTMRGTVVANAGAITMTANDSLEGRMLSTTGAVTITGVRAALPLGCGAAMLTGPTAPTFGSATCYAIFSGTSNITNSGTTHVIGDIGSNGGTTSGFNPAFVTGTIHTNPDVSTANASVDVNNTYSYLNALPYDIDLLFPAALGNGLTLTPHTYRLNGPTTLTDTLYMDAEGDTDAVFVLQVNSSFTSMPNSRVVLVNGARANNIYWKVDNNVLINTFSFFNGNIVADNGTFNINNNAVVNGRALINTGTIGVSAANVFANTVPDAGTISGDSAVCVGSTITLTEDVAGGVWSSTNGHATVLGGVVTGVSAGVDTIMYTVVNSCTTGSAMKIITIQTFPDAGAISGPSNVCVGSSITLTNSATGGIWTASNANAIITPIASGVIVTGVQGGDDTISYAVTNVCGTASVSKVVTVDTFPVTGVILGPSAVCVGNSITLTGVTPGGTWSATNARATVIGGIVTGFSAGIDTIKYTIANSCGSDTAFHPVTVNPATDPGTISGPSTVCVGSSITLTEDATGGTWSSSNANSVVTPTGMVTGLIPGTSTIRYIVTGSCGSDTATHLVTISPTPDAGTVNGPSSVCVGSSITLTDATPGGVWTVTNTHASVAGGIVTGLTAGVDTVVYTVINTCGIDTATKTITVNGLPNAGVITGPSSVCVGSTITLADAAPGGLWTITNNHATLAGTSVTGVSAGLDTVRYIVGSACGTDTATKIITINPAPDAGTITGPSAVCVGSSITLADAAPGGVWTVTNTHASVVGGVITGLTAGVDTVVYTVINTCGTDTATKTITVNAIPNAGTITGPSSVCVGSTITLANTVTGGLWTISNNHATLAGTSVTGVSAGLDTVRYIVGSACGTDTATKVITINPAPNAGSISGPNAVCIGSSITLTNGATGGAWSATNLHAVITPVAGGVMATGATTGLDTIRYIVTNTCGSDTATKVISVDPAPNAGAILGASTVCTGSSITLTDAAPGGVWSASNGSAIVAGGVVTGVFAGTDTIRYTVTNACGSAVATKTVTVNQSANAGTITGPSSVCVGSIITLADAAPGGVWSASNAHATVVAGVVTGITAGLDTISYSVTNTCGTAVANKVISVDATPTAGAISGPSAVCTGSSITLTDPAPGGVWTSGNANATVTPGGVVTGVTAGNVLISYTVTNACGFNRATHAVTVNTTPNAGTIIGLSTVCAGSSTTLTDLSPGGTWSRSNAHATVSPTGVVTGISGGVDTIMYIVSNTCGSDTASHVVTVNPDAGTITGAPRVCRGFSTTLTDTTAGGVWSASNGRATVSPTGVVTGVTAGIDTIMYTVNNICGMDTAFSIISVDSTPFAGTIIGAPSVCVGSSTTLIDAAPGGSWSASNAFATVAGGVVTGVSAGVDTIIYTVVNACGTDIATKTMTVNPAPDAGTITGPSAVCVGSTITLSDVVPGGLWTISNNHGTLAGTSVTGVSAGLDTVMYMVNNGCGTDTAFKFITIETAPNAGTITGPSAVCVGSSITLTDLTPGGFWSSSNASASVASGVVTGVSAGVDTIIYTVTNTCGIDTATHTVNVNALPNAGVINGLSAVCVGSTITLSSTVSGGLWIVSNATATLSGTAVTGVSQGIDTVMYIVNSACGADTAMHPVTVNGLPNAGVITGPSDVCVGSSITLSNTVTAGLWIISNNTATLTGTTVTGLTDGIDTVMYIVNGACGADTAMHIVNVHAVPTLISSSTPAAICDSSTFSYLAASSVAGTTFKWIRPFTAGISNNVDSGITSTISEQLYNITNSTKTTMYIFTLTSNGCSSTQGVIATVYPTPKLAVLSDTACNGAPFVFNPAGLTVGTTYTWSRNATPGVTGGASTGTGSINDVLTTSSTSPVNVVYVYTLSYNSCTFVQNVNVTLLPSPTGPALTTVPPANVFKGTMYQNIGTSTPPATGVTYTWYASNATIWAQGNNKQYALINFDSVGVSYITLNASVAGTACPSQSTMMVTVSPTLAQTPTVTYFSSHFVCTPNDEDSYQWGYDNATTLDSTILTGEINQDYLNTAPDYANKYYWVMTRNGGNVQKTYYNAPTGVQEVNNDVAGISAYPNPTTGYINVEITSMVRGEVMVEVTNMLGQKTNVVQAIDNKATLDVASLPAGVYMVTCYRDGAKIGGTKFFKN